MNLGEKIKRERVKRRITQSSLAADKITRNMLSLIESGKTSASIETIEYLASRLDIPVAYLFSSDDDLFFYRKKEKMPAIREAIDSQKFNVAISLVHSIDGIDDELAFILAECYFKLGVAAAKSGSLNSAQEYLCSCLDFCEKTVYDTSRYEAIFPIYYALAKNVNSPLLEFEEEKFLIKMNEAFDYEFYKYLTLDLSYPYKNELLKAHIDAKILIRERKYSDALKLLVNIEENKSSYERNAYVMFGVYTDMEACYKQIVDFENAYKYASKRISLLEGFQT